MTMPTTKMQLAACHVRKFRWNPPLSFPPPTPYRHRRCAKLYNMCVCGMCVCVAGVAGVCVCILSCIPASVGLIIYLALPPRGSSPSLAHLRASVSLSTLLVSHVSRGSTDQTRHRVLFHVFRHVEAHYASGGISASIRIVRLQRLHLISSVIISWERFIQLYPCSSSSIYVRQHPLIQWMLINNIR